MKAALPAALALFLPAMVAAQSASITPSVAVSEVYDGNLFAATNNPQRSLVHRFGPRIEFDGKAAPFSLVGRYVLDVDYVQALPDNGFQIASQLGSLQLRYHPMKRLTLDADVSYLDARTLVLLNATRARVGIDGPQPSAAAGTLTALDRGRLRAQRFSVGPSLDYQIDRRTRSDVGYLFTRDHLLGLTTDAHVARSALSYAATRTDTASSTLLVRKFVFDAGSLAPSIVLLAGLAHHFSARTVASLRVGPRFRDFDVDGVEGDATLRHGFGHTELELGYTRAETVTLGLPGSREIDEAAFTATTTMKPTVFRASTGVARTHGAGIRANLEYLQLGAGTQVDPWVLVELAVSLSWQQLQLTTPVTGANGTGHVFHDLVAVSVVIAPPKPLEL